MTNIYKLFLELNKELKSKDINSDPFEYLTNGDEESIQYLSQVMTNNEEEYDRLQMLEEIKFGLEDMIFNCQTAIYAIETVKKKEDDNKLARIIFGDEKFDEMLKED